ncbi:hypothetical protein RHSIM_Rhsim01G0010300 [Rhododendron simsii]|uniref:Uncharacterized protein n=1 Tax=Rhododendron simsii TaxID=118357 RepID=A0A834HI44_RHOSS|nr:hypothetical protein RHSIM_Rhsim01G0010300 [Rhododendron simsii]
MKGYEILGFLGILRECIKVISKNGKLIATITTISILLKSLLLVTMSSSTMPTISYLFTQETLRYLSNPNTTIITFKCILKDVQIIIGFEFLYLLPSLAISLFSFVTMVLASVVAYSDRNLSFADFLRRIPKLCFRTLVTSFHLTLLGTGYFGLFLILLISLVILCIDHPLVGIPIVITLGFLAFIFYMYLAVVWNMASVISVIEKSCYGIQAFGKAEGLVKGKRLHGFTLSLLYTIVMVIISNSLKCKELHGEEVELEGSLEYSKIPEIEAAQGQFLRSAMKGYEILGFLGILRECMKVISKNGKLIATITTITIFLNSLLFFTEFYSSKPRISNLLTEETLLSLLNSNFTDIVDSFKHIKKDVQIAIGFEFLYFLLCEAVNLFSLVIVILGSAVAYSNRNMSFGDFLSRIPKSCLRTLVTMFHFRLYTAGNIGLLWVLRLSVTILRINHLLVLITMIIFIIFSCIFYTYVAVIWEMALVISVIEKSCYGLGAFGKAEGLVKGKRLHGFTLSLLLIIVLEIFNMSFKVRQSQQSVSTQIIRGFFATAFVCLVATVYVMSYTVLYFQCKELHGEDVELEESLEYSKIPEKEAAQGQVRV